MLQRRDGPSDSSSLLNSGPLVVNLLFLSFIILSQHLVAALQQSRHNLIACSFTKLDNNELLVSLTLARAFCNEIGIHY